MTPCLCIGCNRASRRGKSLLCGDCYAIAAAARQGGDAKQAPGAAPQSGHEVASPKPSQGAEQQQCRSGR